MCFDLDSDHTSFSFMLPLGYPCLFKLGHFAHLLDSYRLHCLLLHWSLQDSFKYYLPMICSSMPHFNFHYQITQCLPQALLKQLSQVWKLHLLRGKTYWSFSHQALDFWQSTIACWSAHFKICFVLNFLSLFHSHRCMIDFSLKLIHDVFDGKWYKNHLVA